ncbi:IS630 family transposase (plasmid) [Mesorhizobium sp. AR02]|uniref:IS630 family transposase n=1 Tax=Mesorhizobium sp. AR02 TaxID=2865837 RepID=UPI00215F2B29|nr:IS630 family transposase [Mesorhizobium sp. AR02]UVK49733.1 IS630 family transposase [Mesorhizobium sp. AR02]
MNIRYRVELSQSERDELRALVSGGKLPVRRLKRMQILLAADAGVADEAIAISVQTSDSTIYRTKKRFVEISLEAALSEGPRPGAARKLSGKQEVQLVALACSDPPQGCARWTLKLLANALVEVIEHPSVSRDTVRRRLNDNDLKPWQQKMWCIANIDGEYIARMEDLLDLYAEPHDPKRPVVCFDESPIQLIGEVRVPIVPKPGKRYRYDSEYKRNGTANLFVMVDANRSWRRVKVTDRRANEDFAVCMRDLVDVDYPGADKVRVVMDNLSTHTASAVYQTFPAVEARRILRRLEFHYTPRHASWLNIVEIEIGVMRRQCLDRRIASRDLLETEVRTWERRRTESGARIRWMFSTQQARAKMAKSYPTPSLKES